MQPSVQSPGTRAPSSAPGQVVGLAVDEDQPAGLRPALRQWRGRRRWDRICAATGGSCCRDCHSRWCSAPRACARRPGTACARPAHRQAGCPSIRATGAPAGIKRQPPRRLFDDNVIGGAGLGQIAGLQPARREAAAAGAGCAGPHRRQSTNGSVTRMVSSRSGLVDTSATGVSISSCTRWIYLIACAGRSAHERAPAVVSLQPSISS
jgi:hypothetical protein